MAHVLVTGGAGYIGSHTCVELIKQGYQVTILDNLSNSHPFVLDRIYRITGIKPDFLKIDLVEKDALEKAIQTLKPIDAVIHFAAWKSVGESVQFPLKYYHNNITGLVNLLQIMEQQQIKNIVFSSSCSVYGNATQQPVTENTPLAKAESPYGNTKKIGENILEDASKTGHFKVAALRYFNPIGAHNSGLIGELPLGAPTNLVPVITQTAAGIRSSMGVFGNDYPTRDGSCIRDYIHVVDLAQAHVAAVLALLDRKLPDFDVINLGTGHGVTVLEAIETFELATGKKVNFTIEPRREGDVVQIWAECLKSKKTLNWSTEKSLDEAMKSAWKWQLEIPHLPL